MNPTIFLTALRQRFASRPRLVLVAIVFLFPIAVAAITHELGLGATKTGALFAFLLGAGILGQESASGVLQLLFARPVRRWQYVLSRWLAVATAASGLVVIQIGLVCLVLASRGLPDVREIAVAMADQVLQAAGTASVILLFSSLLSGVGDVLAIVLIAISGQVLNFLGQIRQSEAITRAGAELLRFIGPQVPVSTLFMGGRLPWFDVVSYLSTVSLSLAVAVFVLNQREISYASE